MKLKEIRLKNKKTQKEIAEILQTNRVNYNRYELEKGEPNINTLIKLADYYHITIDELVGRTNSNIIDKGLLNETEISILEITKELNPKNQNRLESYALALYETQKDEERIINKVKNNL